MFDIGRWGPFQEGRFMTARKRGLQIMEKAALSKSERFVHDKCCTVQQHLC